MYLISPNKKQFKANLHSHSTISDGKLSPAEMKQAYKEAGYSVLAITDHEVPYDHTALSEPDFLMLTGYEAYIRPDPDCAFIPYNREVHMNLFAKDPHNITCIGYDPPFCKYIPEEQKKTMPIAGPTEPRKLTADYTNRFIAAARQAGYLVSYNHSVWAMQSEAEILALEGIFSLEMVNYNSYLINGLEHNGALYDRLLCEGKRLFCHGVDDNHNKFPFGTAECDSFGGVTMILAEDLSYDSVVKAMETGEMYSTMGPVIKSLSFERGVLRLECSPVTAVRAFFGGKLTSRRLAEAGETVTALELPVPKDCRYLRLQLTDRDGRFADTRAYFRDELGLGPL